MVPSNDEKNLAVLCHLTALLGFIFGGGVCGFVGPLVFFLTQKDKSAYVYHHARESLNHQITFIMLYLICGAIIFVGIFFCFGPLFFIPVIFAGILSVVFEIMACVQASRGEWSRIPWSIRFLH